MSFPLQPFTGTRRKLVLAFDVGTTYSGIAYALLDPGKVPKIQGVTRFPGQQHAAGDSKIPSIVYYTQDGKVRAVGAEAARPGIALTVEDEDLIFVEWFKLHLRPDSLDNAEVNKDVLPKLPPGKTVVEVFADFLKYLYSCAKDYITETHANGQQLWNSVEEHIDFVLSHPNGWEGLQQSKMRRAAIAAGLIKDTATYHSRVHFVTEGEASLQFCIRNGLASDCLETGRNVMIIDAGGGTVDLSSYTFASTSPLSVEEISSPDCIMQGSISVNSRAGSYLQGLLLNSAYGNAEDLRTMLEYFDKSTKPIFKSAKDTSYIKFGSMKCTDSTVGIRRGQLMLAGETVASFFQPSIAAVMQAVERQCRFAAAPITTAFLVGGFAASPWLFHRLQESLQRLGVTLFRPDSHINKAVAEGAVSFYLDHNVSIRISKLTYGTRCLVHFDALDPEHIERENNVEIRPSGRRVLPDSFSVLLAKGSRMQVNEEVSLSMYKEARHAITLDKITSDIRCYRGSTKNPRWVDMEPERYSILCSVFADTSKVVKCKQHGSHGPYYSQDFKIILLCGLTELKAQISWIEDGEEKRGPAEVIYDDEAEVAYF